MGSGNKKLIVLGALGLTSMAVFMVSKVFKPTPAPTPIIMNDANESVQQLPQPSQNDASSSKTDDRPRAILVQGGSIPTFRMPPPKKPKTSPTPCSSTKPGSVTDPGCKVE